ncbi:MAG: hypothetical protein A2015_01665 [Spirochaetes bacterium GWF1_31_7]|nr:MAG: hypothetical protein A2Y30_03030 [Spirochaetes bacterium GWE1_32_154]OHD48307.1 MAG: hypothetical protein A2Y29_05545 [Spirochaetes bacterium GWE2_31_10]OHD49295.1 MAG: hypothetical protein A2015_01665 [Spirochaetes bacterium GWF1_31_7]OHD81140.1 MAG: hypothetical protein A2355_16555 [Spirochaetes bacterium RIFOXYB1_FULL_32_8]HBD92965.1 50S rRNA methyltransferase [Spirochaetia bacterium]
MNDYENPDFYSRKAKDEGYFARSIYKLEEIDSRFSLIKKGMKIVDLGCAPGSWCQYLSNIVGDTGLVVGIDYKKILVTAPNIVIVHGNFLRDYNQAEIMTHGPFNGIVSDMAPDTTGDRLTDCFNSSDLVKDALRFSYDHLKKSGFFVAKIFQGGDEKAIFDEMKMAFKTVKWFKPKSCRKISFETFIIGMDFTGKPQLSEEAEDIMDVDNYSGDMPW